MEQATGAVDLEFLHAGFTNAYINVTNVVLVLTPSAATGDTPAVLVNAHFDSTLGSPGLPLSLDKPKTALPHWCLCSSSLQADIASDRPSTLHKVTHP